LNREKRVPIADPKTSDKLSIVVFVFRSRNLKLTSKKLTYLSNSNGMNMYRNPGNSVASTP